MAGAATRSVFATILADVGVSISVRVRNESGQAWNFSTLGWVSVGAANTLYALGSASSGSESRASGLVSIPEPSCVLEYLDGAGEPLGEDVFYAASAEVSVPSAGDVASAVWESAASGHGAGTTGAALDGISVPTAGAVADAVWDELTTDHQIPGSTGEAVISTAAAGTGSVTVTLLDQDDAALAGASLTLLANGVAVGAGTTNASGVAVLAHDGGAVVVQGFLAGYTIPSEDLGVLAGDTVTTSSLVGTLQTATAAANPAECNVYATLKTLDGAAGAGIIGTARLLSIPSVISENYYAGTTYTATSNASGVILWTLPRGAVVLIAIPNYAQTQITVPGSASSELSTL